MLTIKPEPLRVTGIFVWFIGTRFAFASRETLSRTDGQSQYADHIHYFIQLVTTLGFYSPLQGN
jgi:hypothetical protein